MSKINILDSTIYNRISAGEVVERPFSVVKELVENSIDAGATKINIDIVDGGITSIKITDNGQGIEKSELKSAILPHATSKISKVEDLDTILTLGFRGEALASIASVSKLKIVSKPKEQDFGAKIEVNGGVIQEIEDWPLTEGTEITVDNIFYNTPVRHKFLKTSKSEEGDISNLVSRLILGNPDISIKYTANNKLIYQSYGDGLTEAMINIYSTKVIDDCFYIDTEKNGLKINGYIGKHYFSKPNRTYQTVFVNDRYINNMTISSSIANAYSSYLMKRQYPFYVINITVPPQIVDVNVHPNKTDVRFANNQIIYGFLYSIISKVLDGSSEAVKIVKDNNENILNTQNNKQNTNDFNNDYDTHKDYTIPLEHDLKLKLFDHTNKNNQELVFKDDNNLNNSNDDVFWENKKFIEESEKNQSKVVINECKVSNKDYNKNINYNSNNINSNESSSNESNTNYINNNKDSETLKNSFYSNNISEKNNTSVFDNSSNLNSLKEENKEPTLNTKNINVTCNSLFTSNNTKNEQQSIEIQKQYNIIGQALNTYLIFDDGVDLYLIDQHAAHERVKFDRLMNNFTSKKLFTQPLLAPYILEVNNQEIEFLDNKLQYINDLGIDIEKFGYNSYKINSVPTDIIDIDLKLFFDDLLKDLSLLKKETVPNIIYNKIAQTACKSAIKAGSKLSQNEIQEILKLLKGNLGLKCPHGRPVCIKISKTEIEKWFKRIV